MKEVANGMYSLSEYTVAIGIVQAPLIFVCTLLATLGPYWMPMLNASGMRYSVFVCIFWAHLYCVESIGVLIASLIPNFIFGLIIFCSLLSCLFIFNGAGAARIFTKS